MERVVRKRRSLLVVLSAALLVGVLWLLVWQPLQLARQRQAALARLPALPPFTQQNASSIAGFREADRRARESPRSAEAVGRLGMLYHSYRFMDEARACYQLARSLAPEAFEWIYYLAYLEKTAFRYPEAETAFTEAIAAQPTNAELWAQLGDLYLMWSRRDAADTHLERALELDPHEPLAAIGRARLVLQARDWNRAIELLTPILDEHPRLSIAHKYLAVAYETLGRSEEREHHLALSEYGSALESPRMRELHELSVEPILTGGDPAAGPALLEIKCSRCHTRGRIDATRQDRHWWARTIRRMQRQAGWAWLTDDEAAAVVAYLTARRTP